MAQQQQGFGQVNVIINVAMGVFLAPPFLSSALFKHISRRNLPAQSPQPNDYLNRKVFNRKPAFVWFYSLFRCSPCCLLVSAQGVRALHAKHVTAGHKT
jgi:hypothetical protein